jgi:hypothetical protein
MRQRVRAASASIALSNASGPSRIAPVICPRSAILQRAAVSIVDGILVVTVSTAERIATRGLPSPICVAIAKMRRGQWDRLRRLAHRE